MEMKYFDINSSIHSSKEAPVLRSPQKVGQFCLDRDRSFQSFSGSIPLLTEEFIDSKLVSFDLNKGMKSVIRKNMIETKEEKLDRLLQFILLNAEKFHTVYTEKDGFTSLSTDFVCFRGLLTDLLCVPYEWREGWIIHAMRYHGTIYLLSIETEDKKIQRQNETELQKKMCSWGFKFEQYMIENSEGKIDTDSPVDENEEFCCVVRSRLGSHSLVYGAEVDGIDRKLYRHSQRDLQGFVELKTSKTMVAQREIHSFHRFKLRKWWCQSHLVGIPRIICGFRDADGIVNTLKEFKVEDIPIMAKSYWSPEVMLRFLDDFFGWVKNSLATDEDSVFEIKRLPKDSLISCRKLAKNSEDKFNFMPKFYTEHIFAKQPV